MIASLPMYDLPATRAANDSFWQTLRGLLGRGPRDLNRTTSLYDQWCHPDLLLSQTCGMPYRLKLRDHVQLVGTPDYGIAGCPPGYYRSHLIVREADQTDGLADYQTATVARNDALSQSGWAAFRNAWAAEGLTEFEGAVLDTGSHRASAMAVAEGSADIAAIDAVTWALIARDTGDTKGLRILQSTPPTPGLPLITGPKRDAQALYQTVDRAIAVLPVSVRDTLMLKGLVHITATDYLNQT